MKKILLLLLMIPSISFAQSIKTSEVDSFTGMPVVYTDYETLSNATMKNSYEIRYCFYKENEYGIRLRLMIKCPTVLAIRKEAEILIKTDKAIHTLLALDSNVSTQGGGTTRFAGSGAIGMQIDAVGYLDFLEKETIQDIRIHYTDGYKDANKIKPKNATLFTESYRLIKKEIDKIKAEP